MFDRFKSLLTSQRLPVVDGLDYTPLTRHPHFRTFVTLEPHFPDEGPSAIRSWFGGKPQMPADTPWPKDNSGAPCLFLVQICCADLPPDLWGDIGPMDGWLLFFAAPEALDLRVLHIAGLGPERHEDCGADTTHWEWRARNKRESGAPRFHRFPVRPVTRTMPANMALPIGEVTEAPPLRPRTWGEFDLILSWLEEELAPSGPLTPEVEEANRAAREQMQATYDAEPATRRAMRAKALANSTAAKAAFEAGRAEALSALRPWLSRSVSRGSDVELTGSDWSEFVLWTKQAKRPTLKQKVIAPEVPPGPAEEEAPYCLWWQPVSTKAEFTEQAKALSAFRSKHAFSGKGSYYNLELARRHASAGKGGWTDDQEQQFQREKRVHDIEMSLKKANAAYSEAVGNMIEFLDPLTDTTKISSARMQEFLKTSRNNVQCARWVGATTGQPMPPIIEETLTFDAALVPGLTAEGLVASREAKAFYDALGRSLIDDYLDGTLPTSALPDLRAYAAHIHQPGRTMGGLPFFGYHEPNVMDLQAYASPKQRAALDDPTSRALYGDPETMEPQCLMLNLGSHDPTGWLWGDCYTLTIHMPRADLEAGSFDRMTGYIDNG